MDKVEFFECSCKTPEHFCKFDYDEDFEQVSMNFYLNHYLPWYKRLWAAIKYVFGKTSNYGHFDNMFLSEKDCNRLISFLEKYKGKK